MCLFDSFLFALRLIKTTFVGNGLGIAAKKSTVGCHEHIQRISIEVQVNGIEISDSFDWDLTNPDNSPEEFAVDLVADFLLQTGQIMKSFQLRSQLE